MTSTIQKISFATVLTAMLFVAAFSYANNASAQVTGGGGTGCSDCGGGSTGGGDIAGGGGNDGGGNTTIPAPVCDISANKQYVNPGEQYTISWSNGSTGTYKVGGVDVERTGFLTYTWNADNIFLTFTVTGKNSSGATCSDTVTVYRYVEAPVCDITTNLTAANDGQQFTISWNGTPAHSTVYRVNNQIVAASDSQTYTWPAGRTTPVTVTLTGTNAKGTCTDSVTVNPVTHPVVLPICDSFTSNPTSIVRGNSATLTWATTNATGVSINQGIGGVAVDGTRVVSPTNTTTYTLTATKDAKTVSCPVTVTVTDVPTPLTPICDSFTANASTINRGQSSVLTWNTTNVNSVSINNAIGNVNVDGNVTVSPLQTITYTLTGVGSNNQQVSCPVTVTVNQPENPVAITCAANVNFSASPTSIREGNSSTLTWNTTGVTGVRFNNGINATDLDGSVSVSPRSDTTYTLTATKGNDTINCPVTINVDEDNNGGGGGGGSSAPKCTLKISDKSISRGDRVTLTWDTTRATEVTIKDNHGKTLIDTDGKSSSQKKDLYDGEITLRPEKDTTYTLVAEKGSRDKTCKVSVDVEDTVVVTQVRDQQPLVTGIALTNVPYTGFEAGPFMTSVFYTLLAAWALYMAYVLVGRRNAVNASAFTPATVNSDIVPSTQLMPEKITAAPAFYQAPAPVAPTTAVVGYEAHTTAAEAIEAQAHSQHVLLSTDAIAYFIGATANEDRATVLAQILTAAKASYPSEEGWVTITTDRMIQLAQSV